MKSSPAKSNPPRKLTIKQEIFVKEYIKSKGNGTKSALIAYDTVDYNTAKVISCENLTKLNIKDEIMRLTCKAGLTPERAITRLTRFVDDDEQARWALPLWFDVTGLKAPQKVENTHKMEFSASEENELISIRKSLNSQVIDNK